MTDASMVCQVRPLKPEMRKLIELLDKERISYRIELDGDDEIMVKGPRWAEDPEMSVICNRISYGNRNGEGLLELWLGPVIHGWQTAEDVIQKVNEYREKGREFEND